MVQIIKVPFFDALDGIMKGNAIAFCKNTLQQVKFVKQEGEILVFEFPGLIFRKFNANGECLDLSEHTDYSDPVPQKYFDRDSFYDLIAFDVEVS